MVVTAAAVQIKGLYVEAEHSRRMYELEVKTDKILLERNLKTDYQSETQNLKTEYERELERLRQEVQAKKAAKLAAALAAAIPEAQAAPAPAPPATTGGCSDWIRQAGVTDVGNALWLINKESGCRTSAINKSSGACGIPQALPCSKLGSARGNPVTEIQWMNQYVIRRYGSWANAVVFHRSHNWY